jgi:chaperonin GroEL
MNARLATTDESTLAGAAAVSTIGDQGMTQQGTCDQSHVGTIQFDSGYLSPHFVTHPERMEVTFEDVYILIHQGRISSKKDLLPLLAQIAKSGKPLLIIAEDIRDEALATLVVKKLRGPLQVAAVRAPGVGDRRKQMLQNIALLTSARAIGEGIGLQLKNIQLSDLGQASKILIDNNSTVVEYRASDNTAVSFVP